MPTGDGKTMIAMAISCGETLGYGKIRLFILIVSPYQNLVNQWTQISVQFEYEPKLAYKGSTTWVKLT